MTVNGPLRVLPKLKELARGVARIANQEEVWIEYGRRKTSDNRGYQADASKDATFKQSHHSGDLDYVVMAIKRNIMIPLNTVCVVSAQTCERHAVIGIPRFSYRVTPSSHRPSDR